MLCPDGNASPPGCGGDCHLYICVKSHLDYTLKKGQFITNKLYLSKPNWKKDYIHYKPIYIKIETLHKICNIVLGYTQLTL
jgi:hypothetical protein